MSASHGFEIGNAVYGGGQGRGICAAYLRTRTPGLPHISLVVFFIFRSAGRWALKMSMKVLLAWCGCPVQDVSLAAGTRGLSPAGLGWKRCLGASLAGAHVLIARLVFSFAPLITGSLQEKGLAAENAVNAAAVSPCSFFPLVSWKLDLAFSGANEELSTYICN